MFYLKIFTLLALVWIIKYIYVFIKLNRKEISTLFRQIYRLQNPIFIFSFIRLIIRIVRRIFFRL